MWTFLHTDTVIQIILPPGKIETSNLKEQNPVVLKTFQQIKSHLLFAFQRCTEPGMGVVEEGGESPQKPAKPVSWVPGKSCLQRHDSTSSTKISSSHAGTMQTINHCLLGPTWMQAIFIQVHIFLPYDNRNWLACFRYFSKSEAKENHCKHFFFLTTVGFFFLGNELLPTCISFQSQFHLKCMA